MIIKICNLRAGSGLTEIRWKDREIWCGETGFYSVDYFFILRRREFCYGCQGGQIVEKRWKFLPVSSWRRFKK